MAFIRIKSSLKKLNGHDKFIAGFLICLGSFLLSCKTQPQIDPRLELISKSQYLNTVDYYSARDQVFSGLQNTIDLHGTMLNSEVMSAQLQYKARVYLWEKEKFMEETAKANAQMKKETSVFVSFYTPERKHNQLNKSKDLWKIFLDVNGKRYEALKPLKMKELVSEVQGLYHYHQLFSTPYILTFPVSTFEAQKGAVKLTVTGPVASASIDFPAVTH